jgi:membrane-anchored mycosin MYCP
VRGRIAVTTAALLVAAATVVGAPEPPVDAGRGGAGAPPAAAGAAPAIRPAIGPADAGRRHAPGPATDPAPPPDRLPRGLRPGPAPGLRAPARCAPPPSDGPSDEDDGTERRQLAELHRLATGRGRLVAVIDTGVSPHPRLGSRLRGGGDYLTGGDGLDDCDGHGTAVAGLVAAGPARGQPAVGIAPQAQVLAIRHSSPSFDVPAPDGGRRPPGDTATLAEAVVLAVRAGADVVNVSEAVCLPADRAAAAAAALRAALRAAAAADVVVVAAAGNVGSGSCTAEDPGQVALPGWLGAAVLAVGAVGPDDAPAAFTVPGPWVDVAAPGTGLRSLAVDGGTTGGLAGTSFAAPRVAGLAALVRERFPELTAAEVVDRILATARAAPDPGRALGHGVVDPVAALTALPARLSPPQPRSAVVAELLGTRPVVAPAAPAGPPLDLVAVATLLLAAALTAGALRRRPGG